jgi:hypothetical protein
MEAKLKELVERVKTVAADNVKTLVLFGSGAAGEYSAGHSDLNILCIVERAGSAELEALHPVAEWWARAGNPPPLVFTMDELRRSADVFAVELLDMKQRHRILLGEDFLEQFNVPMNLHRLQVERELRTDWLRLREAILTAPQKRNVSLGIMLQSVSTFCALFRHALLALGQPMPETKRQAVEALATMTGADPTAFFSVLDVREGKRKENKIVVEEALHSYLEFVELVTNEVDRRLEGQ